MGPLIVRRHLLFWRGLALRLVGEFGSHLDNLSLERIDLVGLGSHHIVELTHKILLKGKTGFKRL